MANLCAIAAFVDALAKRALGAKNHGFNGVAVFDDRGADRNGDGDSIAPPGDFGCVDHAAEALGGAFDFVATTFGEDGEELIALPATEIVGGAHGVFKRLADDAKNDGNGARTIARLHFIEVIELHAEDGERNVVFFEEADVFADVGLRDAVIEHAARFVDAAVGGELGLAAIPFGERDAFFETFGGADDDAFRIAHRKSPELNRDAVAGFMTHGDQRLREPALAHRSGGGSECAGELIVFAIGFTEEIIGEKAADDVLAQVAGDALGAIVPEQNFAFAVDDVDGDVKIVEDAAKEVDFRKARHTELRG